MTRPGAPFAAPGDADSFRAGSVALGKLLYEISLLMGFSTIAAQALRPPQIFRGPGGLRCRFQFAEENEGCGEVTEIRPEVLLPVCARDLMGPRVERLLIVQQALMLELGWYLGLSSEGLLQLSPLSWIGEASAAVQALDLGQTLGLQVMRVLYGEDASD